MRYEAVYGQDEQSSAAAVFGDEAPQAKAKTCCTWTWIRRLFRIFFLVLIIVSLIVLPIILFPYLFTHETVFATTDSPIKVILKNCKLYFEEDSGLGLNQIEMKIDLPGRSYSLTTGSVTELRLTSSVSLTEVCVVDVKIHPQAQFKDFEIVCEGACKVLHRGPHPLNIGSSTFVLRGGDVEFMSVQMTAGRFAALIDKGNVHLYNLEITNPSLGFSSISTSEGDIVVQSTKSMVVEWSQPQNNICLYAPTIATSGGSVGGCESSVNGGSGQSGCNSGYVLCKQGEACTSSTVAVSLHLSSAVGNVYANVIDQPGQPVSSSVNSIRGYNFTKGIAFDSNLNKSLATLKEETSGSAQADPVIWVDLGNRAFSTAEMVFLLVASEAYLNGYPWWISFVSANLLIGKMHKLQGNLAPGICPFKTLPTTEDVYTVQTYLLSNVDMFSSKPSAAFLYSKDYPTLPTTPSKQDGFKGIKGSLQLYTFSVSSGLYSLKEYGLKHSISLLLALATSLLLAVLIGIVALYVLVIALDKLLTHYTQQSKHINAYSQRVKNENSEEPLEVRRDKVVDSSAPPGKEEPEEKQFLLFSIISKLPSQYMLIDMLVRELKSYLTSSVEEFYNLLFEPLKSEDVDDFQPMMLSKIKECYEQYCFLHQMPEEDLMGSANKKRLLAKGFIFEKKGQEVEKLVKVRWLRHNEEVEAKRKLESVSASATSLEMFVKSHTDRTQFNSDTIIFSEFKAKYMKYCEDKRVPMVVVTRAQLHDEFGIESINDYPYYLMANREGPTRSQFRVNLEKAESANKDMIELNSDKPSEEGPVKKTEDRSGKAKGLFAIVFDILSVILHLICLVLLSCFFIALPLFAELEMARYTLSDYRYKLKYEDFEYAPWNLIYKAGYLQVVSMASLSIAGLYVVIGILDLIVYYRYMTFPTQSFRNIQKMKFNIVSRILQGIEWSYLCFLIMVAVMYISLVGVWAILGAILNPNAYLAYGAAAVTFVSFIGAKITQFSKMNLMGIQALQEMLFSKLQGVLDDIMKKILGQAGFALDVLGKEGDSHEGIFERASRVIQSTPIGKAMTAMGLDPKNVIAGLQGDETALIEIGVKQGIPRDVMQLILCLIKGRKQELVGHLCKFASSPEMQIDPEIIKLGVEIITNPSEMNVPVIITNVSKVFFDLAYKQMVAIFEKKVDDEKMAYLEICKQVFPRFITSLRSFKAEGIDSFLDQYESINEFLFDSVKKKALSMSTADHKVFGKLFNDKGMPVFAIPSYLLKAIRIFNLIALGQEGKPDEITISRVLSAFYYILENFLGADKKLINCLNLVLCSSPEFLTSPDPKEGLLPIEEQEAVLNDLAEMLKIPSTLVRLIWKVWTGNYTIDDVFVKDVQEFFKTVLNNNIDERTLKFILQIFSISNIKISKELLMGKSLSFGVEPYLASIIHLFGESRIKPEHYDSLVANSIFQAISMKLSMRPTETLGLICLLKGDFTSPTILKLFDSLKRRWGLSEFPSELLISLLSLFFSENESDLITAVKRLNLYPFEFLLIGKKLLHPGNVTEKLFEELGIKKTDPNVKFRQYLQLDSQKMWDEWVKCILKSLSAEFRPVKLKVADDTPLSEVKTAVPRSKEETKAEEEKEKEKKEDEADPAEKLDLLVPESIEEVVDDFDPNQNMNFTEAEKKMRMSARILLNISNIRITDTIINELLSRVNLPLKRQKLIEISDIIVTLLVALKNLKESASQNKIKNAINMLADLLQVDGTSLKAVTSVVFCHSKADIMSGFKLLVRNFMSKHEKAEMCEYATFLLDKAKVLKNVDSSVRGIAEHFQIPKIVVKKILAPLLGDDGSLKLSIEEAMLLMDQAGINSEAFTKLGVNFRWPGRDDFSVEEFRALFAGLIVGNSYMIRKLMQSIGLPEQALQIATAMTSENPSEILSLIIKALAPIAKKHKIPRNAYFTVFEIFKYLIGLGSHPALDPEAIVSGYEYLKLKLGILPQALKCIESIIHQQRDDLLEDIPEMIRAFNNLDLVPSNFKISPEVIDGFMTLLSGSRRSLENMAEKMRVNQELIGLCVRLTRITQGDEDTIAKRVHTFQQSPLVNKVYQTLGISPEAIDSFLNLSFGAYKMDAVSQFLHRLNITQHVDLGFVNFLLSIGQSWAHLQSPADKRIYQNSERRLEGIEKMTKYMKPVCKRLRVDTELALIAVRIRQGDIFIIDEHQNYLTPLLPSPNARKLAMGVCGVFTLPIRFQTPYGEYPDKFKHSVSFESSCEILCELLDINPIVPRMMMLDDETLRLIEEEYGMPRKVVAWFVVTLINLPIFVLEGMAMRNFKKMVHMKKLQMEEIMKSMGEAEKKSAKPSAQTTIGDNAKPEQKKEEKKEDEEKKGEDSEGEDSEEESGEEGAEATAEKEEKKGEEKKEEKKKSRLLGLIRASMKVKKKLGESLANIFEGIDFDGELYQNLEKKMNGSDSNSHLNEIFETILFNKEVYTKMDYDYITSKERREGAFNVDEERVEELFGTKEEYYKDIAKVFFVNPSDPAIWLNNETLDLRKTWLKTEERGIRKNVWGELKKMLRHFSLSPDLTNRRAHKYDTIDWNQMLLFMLLVRIRERMNSTYDLKMDERFYSLYCVEMECLGVLIESLAMMKGVCGKEFSRIRFFKVLSLALNANFANTVDSLIVPSLYSPKLFHPMKDNYDNKEELQATLDYCNNIEKTIDDTQINLLNYKTFSELLCFLQKPNDIMDAESVAKGASPYCYEKISSSKNEFEYVLPKDDPLVNFQGEAEILKRKKACVMPEEITSSDFRASKDDLKSHLSSVEAVKFLQRIETLFVVEQEKMDFLLDFAKLEWNVFDKLKGMLKLMGYIKNENTEVVYKALAELSTLRKHVMEWTEEYIEKKIGFHTSAISSIFSFSLKRTNESLIEAIILLAHGVITNQTIKQLASKYGLETNLVQSFFLSAYPTELLEDKEELEVFIGPLLDRLGIREQKDIIFAIIDIYNGKLSGWEVLAEYCCFSKPNSLIIFKCILQFVNWDEASELRTTVHRFNEGALNPSMVRDIPGSISKILTFLFENETGTQVPVSEGPTMSLIRLIDGMINRDIFKIFRELPSQGEELGILDSKTIELIQAFVFMANKFPIRSEYEKTNLIRSSAAVISDWLLALMAFNSEEVKTEFSEMIKVLNTIIFAAIYMNEELLMEALGRFVPMVGGIAKIWNYISNVNSVMIEQDIPLKRLKSPTLHKFFQCILGIFNIATSISTSITKVTKEIEKKKADLRTVSIPIEQYQSFKNKLGKSWSYIKQFNDSMKAVVDKYTKDLDSTPIEVSDLFELEVENKNPIAEAFKLLQESDLKATWEKNKAITLFITGDAAVFLDALKELKSLPKDFTEVIEVVKMIFTLVEMNEDCFKNLINNPAELKKYEGNIGKYFISPIIIYLKDQIDRRLKQSMNEFVRDMLKRASELLDRPELLTQMVMLLHYIRFNSIRKQNMLAIMGLLFDALKNSLSGEIKLVFPKFIAALSGFEDIDKEKAPLSFEERRSLFLRTFIHICMPDFEPRLELIEKLVAFGTFLLKVGSNKELLIGNAPYIAEEIGSLMGVNTQIIQGLFGVMHGDVGALVEFVAPVCKIKKSTMNTVMKIFQGGSTSLNYVQNVGSAVEKKVDDVERSTYLALMKKVNSGEAGMRELFQLCDMEGDRSGGISVDEFMQLVRKLNMPMTKHRVAEIFARIKSKASKNPNELDIQEFEEAIKYVQSKRISEGLSLLGISTNQLIFLFIMLTVILILLFIFIFLGIAAFSSGGTFGSIINSIMPVGAGFGVGQKSPIDFKDAAWSKRLKEVVDEIISMIGI